MNTKWGIALAAGPLLSLLAAAAVEGQPRNAGTKLRGDFGRPSARTTPARSDNVRPSTGVTRVTEPDYEAFSVEPLPFRVGDTVKVTREETKLMLGRRTLASVKGGQRCRVLRLRGPWVGTVIDIDGRRVGGWIWYSHVGNTAAR
jgi:hypothetical protein